MTLLATIAAAAAAADGGTLSPATKHPVILNAKEVLRNLNQADGSPPAASLVKRVSGWSISSNDADLANLLQKLSKSLNRKLKNPRSLDRDGFFVLLGSFFTKIAERCGLSVEFDLSDPDFVPKWIEKLGFVIGKEVAGLIVEGCLVLELWEVIETLILQKLVGSFFSLKLIENLVEKNQSELLCVCAREIPDLKSSELVSILKYFLSPSADSLNSMISVRKRWENSCILAIKKASQRGLDEKTSTLAKEASILLMLAHDGFLSAEMCLHYVFKLSNLDGLVLSSAISMLDGSEVLRLVRYFLKWLEKYQRFPEAGPCPLARSVLGLSECDSVPSLEAIVMGLGLVLDEHLSYLVLNSEFHEDMRSMERVVRTLASEAELSLPVAEIIKHLQAEVRQ